MKKAGLFLTFLILGFSVSLLAVVQTDTININEVVISGTRVEVMRVNAPVSLSVISKEEIRSQEESNILPVISKITPSLFISEIGTAGYALGNGTSGQITIRGVGGAPNAQVLMLVDGQPQYMGIFGHPLPNFHVASNVERVEVIRGPASLLYGSNAMGGVINVITRKNIKEGITASANASYGSYQTQKYNVGVGFKKGKFSTGLSYNHDQTDGHRDTSAFNINNLNVYAAYELNENWSAKASMMLADYSFEDPGSDINPASMSFLGDITRSMATVAIRNKYENSQGGIYGFYNFGTHSFSDGWESDDVNAGLNIYQGLSLWKGSTVTAGFDYKYYGGIGSFGFLADTFLTVNETAGYLLADQKIGGMLSLNFGMRYENHSVYKGELVPQAGLTFKPTHTTIIKGLVSKGFRSPTIMDLYLFAPNAELGPERLWNYETSVSQTIGATARATLTAYLINGSNMIVMQPNPNPGPPVIRANAGEFQNWGVEMETSFQPIQDLTIDLNYSYLNSDKKLYFAPAHQLYVGGLYSIGKFRIALNLNSIGGLYTHIDNSDASDDIQESYLILNTKIIYAPMDFFDLYIAGKNLLNQDYQTVLGYTMPGINVMAGVSLYFR